MQAPPPPPPSNACLFATSEASQTDAQKAVEATGDKRKATVDLEEAPATKQPALGPVCEALAAPEPPVPFETGSQLPSSVGIFDYMRPFPFPDHDPADFPRVMSQAAQEMADLASNVKEAQASEEAQATTEAAPVPPKHKKLMSDLQDAIDKNAVGVASGVGQRFRRQGAADKALAEEYKSLRSDDARNSFRVQWASQTLKHMRVVKVSERSLQNISSDIGRYETMEHIAEHYGFAVAPEKAMAGALRYVKHAPSCLGDGSLGTT